MSLLHKVFAQELRTCLTDEAILMFFLLVPIAYPLLYSFIYTNEVVREVPVAVVDDSHTAMSRDYIRRVDATADVAVKYHCADMEEARSLVRNRDVYGIIRIPDGFATELDKGQQTTVGIFCDMSGMLYYKALLMANTDVSLAMNAEIKLSRAGNTTAEQDKVTEHPIAYEEVALFNPQNGFAAFLIPAVLVLIIQQTLLLGVGISAGTRRDRSVLKFEEIGAEGKTLRGTTKLLSVMAGRAAAYLVIYIPITVYVLGCVPHIFKLVQIGYWWDMARFALPFLLACTFLAQLVSHLARQRETIILLVVFTSVPLLFLSGVSWPGSSIPAFWHYFAMLFPSTFGVNGYIKMNTMGAHLSEVRAEYVALWLLAAVYFVLAFLALWFEGRRQRA